MDLVPKKFIHLKVNFCCPITVAGSKTGRLDKVVKRACPNVEQSMSTLGSGRGITCMEGLINEERYIYQHRDCKQYSGEFSHGRICGQGTMTYVDGSVFTGMWRNDVRNGTGSLTDIDGNILTGEWINDKYVVAMDPERESGTVTEQRDTVRIDNKKTGKKERPSVNSTFRNTGCVLS
eukprot:gene25747-32236_t